MITHPKWAPYIRKQLPSGTIHIYDPIYRINFWAVLGSKLKYMRIMAENGIEDDEPDDGRFAVYKIDGTEIGVIYAKDRETLIHECLHATIWALNSRGIKLDPDNDEPLCYYQDFLYRFITKP